MTAMLDISNLSTQERLDLIGVLWDSLTIESASLPPDQAAELAQRAAAFANRDELLWAKQYVDQAIAEVERGEIVTLEQVEAHLDARFGPLPDR